MFCKQQSRISEYYVDSNIYIYIIGQKPTNPPHPQPSQLSQWNFGRPGPIQRRAIRHVGDRLVETIDEGDSTFDLGETRRKEKWKPKGWEEPGISLKKPIWWGVKQYKSMGNFEGYQLYALKKVQCLGW